MKYDKKLEIPDFMIILHIIKDKGSCSYTKINMEYAITYAHLHRMIKLLTEKQWVTVDILNKNSNIKLTELGETIVIPINEFLKALNITEDIIKECLIKGKTGKRKKKEVVTNGETNNTE